MDETPAVTVFLRNEADVLLLRRSEAVGSYTGRWGAVAGHAEGDPGGAAREEIVEETGIDPATATTLVRRGDPLTVVDHDLEIQWVVHPFLFDCETRDVALDEESTDSEWVAPPAILRRETVPDLWTAYDRVRPRVATVADDRTHGSASISVRALAVLRDEAARAATDHTDGRSRDGLLDMARDLVGARPSMPVVRNRIDRAVSTALVDEGSGDWPTVLETAAAEGIERALTADRDAAAAAADRVRGTRVATLSRSGTVTATLERADPDAVLVAESRPGGEGVGVASDLADRLGDGVDVTLTTDAAFAHQLARWNADVLVVGADALLPDGRVCNKAGTRGAAIAATHAGIDVVVVAASDKVALDPAEPALEERSKEELTDDERVTVANPTFDLTPPMTVDAVVTERGALPPTDVADLAGEYRAFAEWRG